MFNNFERFFGLIDSRSLNMKSFLDKYQGADLGDGLYRLFSYGEHEKWKVIIQTAYPDFKDKFTPFAYDWLGRCFAIDIRQASPNYNKVLMFEIGTADVLQIPSNFEDFHNEEIPNYSEECLASSFYDQWRSICNNALEHNKCVGYKIPLFLGGKDEVENLEISDMEVYWYILSSAKNKG